MADELQRVHSYRIVSTTKRLLGLNAMPQAGALANVADDTSATVQAEQVSGSWGGAVVEIVRSNDGVKFHPLATPVTLTAASMTPRFSVAGLAYLGARVVTPSATPSSVVSLTFVATDEGCDGDGDASSGEHHVVLVALASEQSI